MCEILNDFSMQCNELNVHNVGPVDNEALCGMILRLCNTHKILPHLGTYIFKSWKGGRRVREARPLAIRGCSWRWRRINLSERGQTGLLYFVSKNPEKSTIAIFWDSIYISVDFYGLDLSEVEVRWSPSKVRNCCFPSLSDLLPSGSREQARKKACNDRDTLLVLESSDELLNSKVTTSLNN